MLRLFASLVVVATLCTLVVGCGDDPLQPFADIRWKLRCQVMGGCTGYMNRDMNNYNGEEGRKISCQIQSRGGGTNEFFFKAYQGTDYGIEMSNVSYSGTGGPVGGTCQVRVLEDGSNWTAACGAGAPSAAQPCQITNFRIDPMLGVVGKVWCEGLPLYGSPETLRELTSPDEPLPTDHTAERRGADFNLQNCAGL